MKRVFAMVMAVVMAAVMFAGCSAGGNNNASNNSGSGDTIKVGLLGPHSGEYAVFDIARPVPGKILARTLLFY